METPSFSKIKLFSIFVWTLVFAVSSVFLPVWTKPKSGERILNSPDETANYFFTKLYAEKSVFSFPEPLNSEYENTISPRSVKVSQNDGSLLPGSFLGMIVLYGWIGKFFGSWSIAYITPFLSIFGLIFLYKLFREIFSEEIAFFSTLLFMIFPGWWYYNSRGMFHNVLFVNLFIAEMYHLVHYFHFKSRSSLIFGLIFFFLAVFTRASEAVWLFPLTFFLILFSFQKNIFRTIFWIFIFSLAVYMVFYFQKFVSGSWLGGYGADVSQITELKNVKRVLFPFGINPLLSLKHFFEYYAALFPWYFYPSLLGFGVSWLQLKKHSKEFRWYLIFFTLFSFFLILYYGSWSIADHVDPRKITIGTSYVRYWLPLYVFSMPFIVIFFRQIKKFFSSHGLRIFALTATVFFYIFFSMRLTWFSSDESLLKVYERIQEYYQKRELVSRSVPEGAVIITERSDKIFFPAYPVVVNLQNGKKLEIFKKMLMDGLDVYYYSHRSSEDVAEAQKTLMGYGLELSEKKKIFENEYLYTLKKL